MRTHHALLLALSLAAAGCSATATGTVASAMIPAPASGSAWRVVGDGGATTVDGVVADTGPLVTVDGSGTIHARIPASAQTQQAAGALQAGSFGALTIRRAP